MTGFRDHLLEAAFFAMPDMKTHRRSFVNAIQQAIGLYVRQEIAAQMAAALADPDVDPAAKSLAGYLLRRHQGELE